LRPRTSRVGVGVEVVAGAVVGAAAVGAVIA
jgi:hypothetical protein